MLTGVFLPPLPIELLHFLLKASLAPLGCQKQWTINKYTG